MAPNLPYESRSQLSELQFIEHTPYKLILKIVDCQNQKIHVSYIDRLQKLCAAVDAVGANDRVEAEDDAFDISFVPLEFTER